MKQREALESIAWLYETSSPDLFIRDRWKAFWTIYRLCMRAPTNGQWQPEFVVFYRLWMLGGVKAGPELADWVDLAQAPEDSIDRRHVPKEIRRRLVSQARRRRIRKWTGSRR